MLCFGLRRYFFFSWFMILRPASVISEWLLMFWIPWLLALWWFRSWCLCLSLYIYSMALRFEDSIISSTLPFNLSYLSKNYSWPIDFFLFWNCLSPDCYETSFLSMPFKEIFLLLNEEPFRFIIFEIEKLFFLFSSQFFLRSHSSISRFRYSSRSIRSFSFISSFCCSSSYFFFIWFNCCYRLNSCILSCSSFYCSFLILCSLSYSSFSSIWFLISRFFYLARSLIRSCIRYSAKILFSWSAFSFSAFC